MFKRMSLFLVAALAAGVMSCFAAGVADLNALNGEMAQLYNEREELFKKVNKLHKHKNKKSDADLITKQICELSARIWDLKLKGQNAESAS